MSNDKNNTDYPSENVNDKSYALARGLISSFPVLGGIATEIFSLAVTPSVEKRREAWFNDLHKRFLRLEAEHSGFSFEKVFKDEKFISALLMATRHAQLNHNVENLEALRNAVLNAALPDSPDEARQKIFIAWAGEFTPWHIRILRVFDTDPNHIPTIHLEKAEWPMNSGNSNKLMELIERNYPKVKVDLYLCIQVINELHSRSLISNRLFARRMTSEFRHEPCLTPLGIQFLEFIASPLSTTDASLA